MTTVDTTATTGTTPVAFRGRDLYVQGNTDLLTANGRVTITGSRACTAYGEMVARDAAKAIAKAGGVIITSAGHGIDGAAARAAVAAGARVILVQAAGLNVRHPKVGAPLVDQVLAAKGLIVSVQKQADGAPTRLFLKDAARVMGALAHDILVVEGSNRSNARETAEYASNRWAVPGPITSAASAYPHELLAQKANVWRGTAEDAAVIVADDDENFVPPWYAFGHQLDHTMEPPF